MSRQSSVKQERVVEAVRQGLAGEAAVDFIHQCGYAINETSIERVLKTLGGKGRVLNLLEKGLSNVETIQVCTPEADLSELKNQAPPEETTPQGDAFSGEDAPIYPTTKMSIKIPSHLYEAVRAAAQAEGKTHNELIVNILSARLGRSPKIAKPYLKEL